MFLTNLSTSQRNLEWFQNDWNEIVKFTQRNQLDGIELIMHGDYDLSKIPENLVHGLHLCYWPMWLDFWKNDRRGLLRQFKTEENINNFYGGLDPEVLIDYYKKEFEIAKKLKVKYVVFHVSHVEILHTYSWKFTYNDWDVLKAAAELINESFQDSDESITLLFENLWWPGLNFLDAELTQRFFELIQYKNKGFMLDLAHLMITNFDLKNEREATDYILTQINKLGELKKYIRGIHINASIAGDYLKQDHSNEAKRIEKIEKIWDQYIAVISHIKKIDHHIPFKDKSIQEIIDEIEPDYKIFEVLPKDLEEFEHFLNIQHQALGRKV
ncbi:MAG: TIM barrel protein [Halanaerobiales bacterium]|nr:TIM barrel protein [Halanaerobiales bacterium]